MQVVSESHSFMKLKYKNEAKMWHRRCEGLLELIYK